MRASRFEKGGSRRVDGSSGGRSGAHKSQPPDRHIRDGGEGRIGSTQTLSADHAFFRNDFAPVAAGGGSLCAAYLPGLMASLMGGFKSKAPHGQDIFLSAIFLSAGIRQGNGRQENDRQ